MIRGELKFRSAICHTYAASLELDACARRGRVPKAAALSQVLISFR